MQATQGPKHASNLTHHWPLIEFFAITALHVLRCMLLEIVLNAGSVVLEDAGGVRLPVASVSLPPRRPPRRGAAPATRSRPHVGPFYGASVYSCSLFIRRSTCGSYRIVSRYFVWYRIVSIVFSYGCIVPSLPNCFSFMLLCLLSTGSIELFKYFYAFALLLTLRCWCVFSHRDTWLSASSSIVKQLTVTWSFSK